MKGRIAGEVDETKGLGARRSQAPTGGSCFARAKSCAPGERAGGEGWKGNRGSKHTQEHPEEGGGRAAALALSSTTPSRALSGVKRESGDTPPVEVEGGEGGTCTSEGTPQAAASTIVMP